MSQLATQLNSAAFNFGNQAKIQLDKITKDLEDVKKLFTTSRENLEQTVANAVSTANKSIEALATQAIEVGKKVENLEARRREAQVFLELADMVHDPNSTSPRVLATLTIIMRVFLQLVGRTPHG